MSRSESGSRRRQAPLARRRPLPVRAVLAVVVLAALEIVGCTGSAGRRAGLTPTAGGPRIVVVEEHDDNADFWLIDPNNLANRRRIANVAHRPGWDVRATTSPDGRALAYDVLPRTAIDPDTQGELWTIAFSAPNPKARRLATGVDLRSSLVWSPNGAWLTYERVLGSDDIELRRANASGAGDQLIAHSQGASRWIPMGYTPDGATLLLAHLTPQGTEVASEQPGSAPGRGVPVSAAASRDFTVGPDGRWALLALMDEGGRKVYRALAEQPGGGVARLTAGGVEDTGIAWNPRSGEPTVGVVPEVAGSAVPPAAGARTEAPATGFDVPLGWSPDGAWLAVRHFSGSSTDQPGSETLQIVGQGGRRGDVTGGGPVIFVGWTANG